MVMWVTQYGDDDGQEGGVVETRVIRLARVFKAENDEQSCYRGHDESVVKEPNYEFGPFLAPRQGLDVC